ncbi:3-hydroxyacyl-CoA dehydrogenase family protein [Vannielia litorea]|uniref:3-hydroxyacyl-CoA dehydrogenase family protein n=1 Tax=Vannielia litorea TaxID=1217970 RepID=UPI001C982831|nr:3-hydroxyacyl-CoA dehydrogenase family protein [Vannielia litorea]MBY6048943.1 hypothetical protein [Vannielia litorea]MBY6076357.1 hypothetical protein [Vannielia litorea]
MSGTIVHEAVARLMARSHAEVEALLLEGSNPWELDEALEAGGMAQGPCAMQDQIGLDVIKSARSEPFLVADRMVAEGRLGRKVGVGWFRYPGGGGAVIDPLVEDLIREEAHFAGRAWRELSADALRARYFGAMAEASQGMPPEARAALGLPKD